MFFSLLVNIHLKLECRIAQILIDEILVVLILIEICQIENQN